MSRVLRALGLMSGTSMDGIDVALVETDGETVVRRGPGQTYPYAPDRRAMLEQALVDARAMTDRAARPGVLAEAEAAITRAHAAAVRTFLEEHRLRADDLDIVGFHGQTVLHRPENRLTVQLGDGAHLARLTGTDVVFDFRAADVGAGGEGAPFVPAYHKALVEAAEVETPVAVANLGGVANVTWVAAGKNPVAFDTGPGNALLDMWAFSCDRSPMDRDGALAARGRVDADVLAALMAHPYFQRQAPKSLDRNDFSLNPVAGLSAADGAATLAAFTVEALAAAVVHMPAPPPRAWIVAGGGTKNPFLMNMLLERLGDVREAGALGWSADRMEAEAFAYLAVRSLRGLPLSWPETTGVASPKTGGVFAPAQKTASIAKR